MQKIIYRINVENSAFLDNLSADCYILDTVLSEDFCKKFISQAATLEKIVLLYGDDAVKTCLTYGADGVVLDLNVENIKEQVETLRKTLGKDKFIGLLTRNRRHESMLVSEAEPDFVIFKVWRDGFENVKELIDWYADFFLIQSAAWVMEEGIPLSELSTDFIIKEL